MLFFFTKMFTIQLICFLAVSSIFTVSAEKQYSNSSELLDDITVNVFSCMQELNVNPDDCIELFTSTEEHDDKKYDTCKCFGPCVGKKIGTMDPVTGKWNMAKIKELMTFVDEETIKNEANMIETNCFQDARSHCEAGYEMMKCVIKHSTMIKELINNLVALKKLNDNK